MQAHQNFYDLDEGRIQLGDVSLQTMWLNHPQGCMGFGLETEEGGMVSGKGQTRGRAVRQKRAQACGRGRRPDLRRTISS